MPAWLKQDLMFVLSLDQVLAMLGGEVTYSFFLRTSSFLSVKPETIGYANHNLSVTAHRVVTLSLMTLWMERWNQF